MVFKEKLKEVRGNYQYRLNTILNFIVDVDSYLDKYFEQSDKPNMHSDPDTIEEGIKLRDFLNEVLDPNHEIENGKGIKIKSDALSEVLMTFIKSVQYREFLNEMTLSYLISCQEAILKDYLYVVLKNNPDNLKTGKEKISYDEVLKFHNMDELIEFIIKKMVDSIGYGSVEDVFNFYKDRFNIDFKDFDRWEVIVESSLRRNLIIHNKGIVNDQYCRRFKNYNLNEQIEIDGKYIKSIAENLIEFNQFCFSAISKKFRLDDKNIVFKDSES